MGQTGKIRLSGQKAADALRRSAREVICIWAAVAILITVGLVLGAIFVCVYWYPAVFVLPAMAVLLDILIAVSVRAKYFLLMGQAVSTEAASTILKMAEDEQWRRQMMLDKMANAHPSLIGEVGLEELRRYADNEEQSEADDKHRRRRLAIVGKDMTE